MAAWNIQRAALLFCVRDSPYLAPHCWRAFAVWSSCCAGRAFVLSGLSIINLAQLKSVWNQFN